MKDRLALITLLCCTACRHVEVAPPTGPDPLTQAREDVGALYAGQAARLWERARPEFRKALGGPAALEALATGVPRDLGAEVEVVSEHVDAQPGGIALYTRTVRFAKQTGLFEVIDALDNSGRIAAFGVRPVQKEAASSHLDYQTRADLRLPFKGQWTVVWGGRDLRHNRHAAVSNQRFALDLLITQGGVTHAGDGKRNTDYYCFGQPVLAPAEATVVEAVDGRVDNAPGDMPVDQPLGNHVVLDLGHGEYAFLAHLQQGSVKVHPGQRVSPDEQLGLAGNSGHSSEPHLHFHLQDAPEFAEGAGLPAQFQSYRADGKAIARGELEKGQQIEAQ